MLQSVAVYCNIICCNTPQKIASAFVWCALFNVATCLIMVHSVAEYCNRIRCNTLQKFGSVFVKVVVPSVECRNMLQFVAVCCSILQHTTLQYTARNCRCICVVPFIECCSVLDNVAFCCSILQHNTLQYTARNRKCICQRSGALYIILRHVAVCCSLLQYTAT